MCLVLNLKLTIRKTAVCLSVCLIKYFSLGAILSLALFQHIFNILYSFRFILKVAIDQNIYQSVDFNNNPVAYCGIQITDAPYKP